MYTLSNGNHKLTRTADGRDLLFHNEFFFRRTGGYISRTSYWKCIKPSCGMRVKLNSDGLCTKGRHFHKPTVPSTNYSVPSCSTPQASSSTTTGVEKGSSDSTIISQAATAPNSPPITTIPQSRVDLASPLDSTATTSIPSKPRARSLSSEIPHSKRTKTWDDFESSISEFQVKHLEQQLQSAIQQIDGLREEIELYSQQVKDLEGWIIQMKEKEKKNTIEMNEMKEKNAQLEKKNIAANNYFKKKLSESEKEQKNEERASKKRFAKELKTERDKHEKEMVIKIKEIASLNKQLKEYDAKYEKLKQRNKRLASKHRNANFKNPCKVGTTCIPSPSYTSSDLNISDSELTIDSDEDTEIHSGNLTEEFVDASPPTPNFVVEDDVI